jgi:hypothetical protein
MTKMFYSTLWAYAFRYYSDDLIEWENFVRKAKCKNVVDVCGGFGRIAKAVAAQRIPITVVDSSEELISFGLKHLEEGELRYITWIRAICDERLKIEDSFDVGICGFNALNESIDNFSGIFSTFTRHLSTGSFVRIAHIRDKPPRHAKWRDRWEFAGPDGERWALSSRIITSSNDWRRQTLFLRYRSVRTGRTITTSLPRRIWSPREMIIASEQFGFEEMSELRTERSITLRKRN